MSQEIVYTSAPRGLKPNSSGFCTVLSTNGMARNLSERLESLSGYRFHFPAHDANAHLNPVNYSHLKMTVGGEPFHVLSRICDAGLDHTRRSNKLAHHVAFKAREIEPTDGGSPAWTLAEPGFCETKWEGEPRRVAEGRKRLPESQRLPHPAAVWKSLTGDAGWAGVLAASALEHPPRPMHVIFPAGTDTLALVIEALHLLKAKKRWEVTFSTYFTKLEAGTECQWRFVLDGTQEAKAVRLDPHKPKIDLCSDLGPAPDGDLVEFARTGLLPAPVQSEPPQAAPPTGERDPTPADDKRPATAHAEQAHTAESPDTERLIVAPPRSSRPAPARRERPLRRVRLPWLITGSLLLFLLIAGGMIAAFLGGRGFRTAPELVAENDGTQTPVTERNSTAVDKSVLDSVEKPVEPSPEPVLESKTDDSPQDIARAEPITVLMADEPEEKPLPLEDVINVHKEHLPLPATEQDRTLAGGGTNGLTEAAHLAKIYVEDLEKVTLRIGGQEAILPPGVEFAVTEELSPDRSMKTWEIKEATTEKAAINNLGTPIGKFRLQEDQFSFQWQRNLKSSKLQFCRLIIEATNSAGSEQANCTLFEPYEQPPLRFDFENMVHFIELNLDPRSLPESHYLRMEVGVRGIEESRLNMSKSILPPAASDESAEKIDIDIASESTDNEVGETLLRVEARFLGGNKAKPPQFRMRNQFASHGVKVDRMPPSELQDRLDRIPDMILLREGYRREDIRGVSIDTGFMPMDGGRAALRNARTTTAELKDLLGKLKRAVDGLEGSRWLDNKVAREESSPDQPWTRFSDDVATLASQYADALDEVDAYDERLDEIKELHEELEQSVKIDFRVFIEFDDQEINILRSRSAGRSNPEWKPSAELPKGQLQLPTTRRASSDRQAETPTSEF